MAEKGYSITTYRFRLRCGHPEWLARTQELYDQIAEFYHGLLLEHEEIWGQNSQETLRSLECLSLPGKERRRPECPFPWEKVPPYFRRAAANAGIAAVKSFLSRKKAEADEGTDDEDPDSAEKAEMDLSSGRVRPASELNSAVVFYSRMYRDFSPEQISLKVWNGEDWQWMRCRLSGREFPEEARILSPSVVLEDKFSMLHVPVKEPVYDPSPVKMRMENGCRICGLQFTNGDAFAVGSVLDAQGKETAVRFFGGGMEYSHHCRKITEKIEKSEESLGELPEGPANRKYWMHLKHLSDYYAHRVSREIVRFCEENEVSLIVLPRYREEYTRRVMKGAGNWSPLHLSVRIRGYLKYKAWQSGMIVVETYAKGTGVVCARCGQPVISEDSRTKEYVCRMGHRGNRYLNTARNLALKCRGQFQERESARPFGYED